jgi:hypothetical protein
VQAGRARVLSAEALSSVAYRTIVVPFVRYVEALRGQRPELTVTVVLGELIVDGPLRRRLHDDREPRMRRALRLQRRVVVTTVPFHFPAR